MLIKNLIDLDVIMIVWMNNLIYMSKNSLINYQSNILLLFLLIIGVIYFVIYYKHLLYKFS